jgi:hypothetical protein
VPINQALLKTELERLLAPRVEAGLRWFVDDALSRPGTGILHTGFGYTNPSSAPGEYPAQQTEALKRSMDVRQTGPLTWELGSFADKDAEGHRHALELESRPSSAGGRHFLEKALAEGELAHAILTGQP